MDSKTAQWIANYDKHLAISVVSKNLVAPPGIMAIIQTG